jgi:hypothetical protein
MAGSRLASMGYRGGKVTDAVCGLPVPFLWKRNEP